MSHSTVEQRVAAGKAARAATPAGATHRGIRRDRPTRSP